MAQQSHVRLQWVDQWFLLYLFILLIVSIYEILYIYMDFNFADLVI
jgi:hypothetical protein